MFECITYNISKYHSKTPVNKSDKQINIFWVIAQCLKWSTLWGHRRCFAAVNKNRYQMTGFTAQTNLVVWAMVPLQLQDIWLHNLEIYPLTFIYGVPHSLIALKHFDKMKSVEKKTLIKSFLYQRGTIQSYISQMLFHYVIFLQILPRVHSWVTSQHHNLWFEGCLVTKAWYLQGYPAHLLSGDDHLESSQIVISVYLVFMLALINVF